MERVSVLDPFTTTRTTRKVGLGIPLFKANAESCNGNFSITSELNIRTTVTANFQLSNIDRSVLGNISNAITILIISHKGLDVHFSYTTNKDSFSISTQDIKNELGDISLQRFEVKDLLERIISSELTKIGIVD